MRAVISATLFLAAPIAARRWACTRERGFAVADQSLAGAVHFGFGPARGRRPLEADDRVTARGREPRLIFGARQRPCRMRVLGRGDQALGEERLQVPDIGPGLREIAGGLVEGRLGLDHADLSLAAGFVGQPALGIGNLLRCGVEIAAGPEQLELRVFNRPREFGFRLRQRGLFGQERALEGRRIQAKQHITGLDDVSFGRNFDDGRGGGRYRGGVDRHALRGDCSSLHDRFRERLYARFGGRPGRRGGWKQGSGADKGDDQKAGGGDAGFGLPRSDPSIEHCTQ